MVVDNREVMYYLLLGLKLRNTTAELKSKNDSFIVTPAMSSYEIMQILNNNKIEHIVVNNKSFKTKMFAYTFQDNCLIINYNTGNFKVIEL